uniref:Retrotransposon gag domain-containing protein n=1 Tax=Fagus sylvatica TaxID=28930 RepID=A0A2N9ISJ4_FAGSY
MQRSNKGCWPYFLTFRGLDNENPNVHVRAFEEVIGSFYAQNVMETTKLRFFPFSLKDKTKGWLYTLKPRSIGNWGEMMTQEFYTRNFSLPIKSNRSSTTTSGGSVFRLREEDNMSAKRSVVLTKEIEALKLKGSRGVNVVFREEPMEACRICQEIDHTTTEWMLLEADAPKCQMRKSKEIPAKKDESEITKSNDIEKCPFLAPFPTSLEITQEFGCHK